jgi:hypothetical protein
MKTAWENGNRVPVYDPDAWENEPEEASPCTNTASVMMRRLIGFMLADTNPALGIECLALVTGIAYNGSSMSDIAKRHLYTRAAVSKRCVELCEAFGIPPVRAMRPEATRANCRAARVTTLTAQ